MKLFKCLLLAVFAAVLFCDVNTVAAQQDTKSKSASKQTQKKTKQQKKKRKSFQEALSDSVDDLTEEQKKKIESLYDEAAAERKKINQSVGLTWKLNKQRQEIFDGLSKKLSYKERSEKANSEAGFTEDQIKSLKDVNEEFRKFRFSAMKVLTDNQRAKMPKWYKDDFEKSKEQAAKEAADKKKAEQTGK